MSWDGEIIGGDDAWRLAGGLATAFVCRGFDACATAQASPPAMAVTVHDAPLPVPCRTLWCLPQDGGWKGRLVWKAPKYAPPPAEARWPLTFLAETDDIGSVVAAVLGNPPRPDLPFRDSLESHYAC